MKTNDIDPSELVYTSKMFFQHRMRLLVQYRIQFSSFGESISMNSSRRVVFPLFRIKAISFIVENPLLRLCFTTGISTFATLFVYIRIIFFSLSFVLRIKHCVHRHEYRCRTVRIAVCCCGRRRLLDLNFKNRLLHTERVCERYKTFAH